MRRRVWLWVVLLPLLLSARESAAFPRIVSLNPSITAILLELGALGSLVGVDDWSAKQQPAVSGLPTVGGLFDPNLEAVLALEPDVVVVVPSAQQRDLRRRLRDIGIELLELPNIELEELLASIEALGRLVGRTDAAMARVAAIRGAWREAERARTESVPVPTVLVLQREPLFVVGRGSFLHSMLTAAGGRNLAAGFAEPYPRVALEWLIEAGPEVILDASEGPPDAASFWSRWPSLPAVQSGRVVTIPAAEVTLPGPHPDRGLRILSAALSEPGRSP